MDFIDVRHAATKWNISERRVQKLCEDGRICGVRRFGHSWMIPELAEKPHDLRKTRIAKRRMEAKPNV
ncbi:MAG: helix-turn-helix domain-containing protein [Lachnospiraceae bacterium]|nr:helix-turn-helix domain-containing protein [Lachnospiraceae bacterium]